MTEEEVADIVSALLRKTASNRGSPKTLMRMLHRRRFPGSFFPVLEPLLHNEFTYKYAIDILGNLKEPPTVVSDAICDAWERSWQHGVPQACECAFPALRKIGGNEERLLSMAERSLQVNNYGIHRICVDLLIVMPSGTELLRTWVNSEKGQCKCHRHRKLAERILQHLQNVDAVK